MKLLFALLMLATFSAQAFNPMMSMKERLRLHLWYSGMDEKPVKMKKVERKSLPEEIERPLRKI